MKYSHSNRFGYVIFLSLFFNYFAYAEPVVSQNQNSTQEIITLETPQTTTASQKSNVITFTEEDDDFLHEVTNEIESKEPWTEKAKFIGLGLKMVGKEIIKELKNYKHKKKAAAIILITATCLYYLKYKK